MARRAGSLLLVLLLAAAAAAGAAEPVAPDTPFRICGEDHDYRFQPPPGWKLASDDSDARALRSFAPKGGTLDSDGAMLSLGRVYQDVGVDFDEAFELGIAAFVVQEELPASLGEPKLRHPVHASHAVRFDYPDKQIIMVVVDPRSAGGLLLGLTLTHVGDALPPELLAQLETSLASLRFDAGRICKREADGSVREQAVLRPTLPPEPDRVAPTPQQAALRRATSVCTFLRRLEMPVRCERGLLRGTPVTLASFEEFAGQSSDALMDAFRLPIARIYCWVSGEHALPQLAFHAQDLHGTEPVIPWSCATGKPDGRRVPFKDFQPDRGVSHARASR